MTLSNHRVAFLEMLPMLELVGQSKQLVSHALYILLNHLEDVSQMLSRLGVPAPPELTAFIGSARELREVGLTRGGAGESVILGGNNVGIVRTALSFYRRSVAERVEETQERLATPAQIAAVGQEVERLDAILNLPALERAKPVFLPRLATYFTAHGREDLTNKLDLSPEETDPKHRILLSPSLIPADVAAYRRHCEDRRLPLAIVFIDIDDFKKYNTTKGEVYVDRFVLPPILNAVEGASYGHGRAYRHGGDEFVLLLPNAQQAIAVHIARQVARAVASVSLDGLPPPLLSIGIWITHPDSHLTSTELVEAAAKAKKHAKDTGKNRITVRVEHASVYEEVVVTLDD